MLPLEIVRWNYFEAWKSTLILTHEGSLFVEGPPGQAPQKGFRFIQAKLFILLD